MELIHVHILLFTRGFTGFYLTSVDLLRYLDCRYSLRGQIDCTPTPMIFPSMI